MNDIKMAIAKNIRKFRKEADITQGELADALNVGHSTVSNWERGANTPAVFICYI